MSQAAPKYPSGIPYIVSNEAAERFSYYGMRTILVIFLTKYMVDTAGNPDTLTDAQARTWYHLFSTGVYFFPILGALISDMYWGKYRTIIRLSVVYCIGHLCLALFEFKTGFALGLTLIAIGSGGIKPCVSAHVGDQFTKENSSLIDKAFALFYFSINVGAFISTLLTPILLDQVGPWLAFGVPGALMWLATIVFWMGRKKFTHVPPAGPKQVMSTIFSSEGLSAIGRLVILYMFVAIFWALYDQTGSSWVLQADKMNRDVDLTFGGLLPFSWLQFTLLPSQIQAINPLLILAFIPLLYRVIFPQIEKFCKVTPLRKIGVGLFGTGFSFAIVAYSQSMIDAGHDVSIMWQFFAFVVMTASEVLVSVTALEYSYTQAPNTLKSIIMGVFLLSVSAGNLFTSIVNMVIQNPDGSTWMTDTQYYWFFTALVFGTAIIFALVSSKFKEKTYIQDTQEAIV